MVDQLIAKHKAMNEYKDINNTKNTCHDSAQGGRVEKRSEEDRRREQNNGFTYITVVGWIDRRERLRRRDDPNLLK